MNEYIVSNAWNRHDVWEKRAKDKGTQKVQSLGGILIR